MLSRTSVPLSTFLVLLAASIVEGTHSAFSPRQRPAKAPSAASFYVPDVPNLKRDPTSPLHVWAGHMSADPKATISPVTQVTAQLYFVLTKARRTADKERLIIWFNGGPGCSSFDGLMMEVGPWRMDGKDSLIQKDGGWEEYASVLYVDQPPGTGFSYTSTDNYLHELGEVGLFVVEFLKNWYLTFPEYKNMDTYLAGESYAGQYIPYIADAILNEKIVHIPLKGIAIGNGWIDPVTQYPAYVEFAVQQKLLKSDTPSYKSAMRTLDKCLKVMNETKQMTPHIGQCELVMDKSIADQRSTINGKEMCINVYDISLSDTYPSCGMNWPPDLVYIKPYLRRDDVRTALHAPAGSSAWAECRGSVGSALYTKKSAPSATLLPGILASGVKVMLFSGDRDLICNHVGTERMIEKMTWAGETGFNSSVKPLNWKVNGTDAGEWTSERNLTYAKLFGASHMVGFDVPHTAHDMILRFMGVDFSQVLHGGTTASLSSSIGDDVKPIAGGVDNGSSPGSTSPSKKPNNGDAEWQAYYNAGSAALVLLLIVVGIGAFFYVRARRARKDAMRGGVSLEQDEEESIPLSRSVGGPSDTPNDGYAPVRDDGRRDGRKGKGRAADDGREGEAIFDVGDSDEDEHTRREGN